MIQWKMEKAGIESLGQIPMWHTNNTVGEKKKPSGKDYLEVRAIFSDSIQQADPFGPFVYQGRQPLLQPQPHRSRKLSERRIPLQKQK